MELAIPTCQHDFPIYHGSMSLWRKRVGERGSKKLFKQLLETTERGKILKRSVLNHVYVDTTIQDKADAFPTNARLYHKMQEALVRSAEARGIDLRQS